MVPSLEAQHADHHPFRRKHGDATLPAAGYEISFGSFKSCHRWMPKEARRSCGDVPKIERTPPRPVLPTCKENIPACYRIATARPAAYPCSRMQKTMWMWNDCIEKLPTARTCRQSSFRSRPRPRSSHDLLGNQLDFVDTQHASEARKERNPSLSSSQLGSESLTGRSRVSPAAQIWREPASLQCAAHHGVCRNHRLLVGPKMLAKRSYPSR